MLREIIIVVPSPLKPTAIITFISHVKGGGLSSVTYFMWKLRETCCYNNYAQISINRFITVLKEVTGISVAFVTVNASKSNTNALVPSGIVSSLVHSARLFFCVASMGLIKCGCWSFDGVVGVEILVCFACI